MKHHIAVYFSGHLRNLDETWTNYKKIFENTTLIKFDFYFILWNVNHTIESKSWEHNENVGKKLVEITPISENDIYKICPDAKIVKLIKDGGFEIPEHLRMFPKSVVCQLYGIHQAFQVIPNSYDYYIRMRTDLYFFKRPDFEMLFDRPEYNLILDTNVHFQRKNYPEGDIFNDFFWISNYETGFLIATFYNHIQNYKINDGYLELYYKLYLDDNKDKLKIYNYSFDVWLDRRTKGFDSNLEESYILTKRRQEFSS